MKLREEIHTEELVLAALRDQDPPRRAANTAWRYYEARECADRIRLAGALLRKAGPVRRRLVPAGAGEPYPAHRDVP